MDMEKGGLVEKEALLQPPESLYNMTDPNFMYEALKSNLMLQMTLFCSNLIQEIDIKPLNVLAEILDFSPDVPDQRNLINLDDFLLIPIRLGVPWACQFSQSPLEIESCTP